MKAMESFVESVKRGGLGAAAKALGVSRTIVSRNIQALENDLGVRLMNRTTRSLALTETGQGYFHFCDDILTRVAEMDQQVAVQTSEARGELSVLAPKWMQSTATHLLVDFVKAYPDIRPTLILGGMAQTAYGFLEQGCDIALHTRQIPDSRIVAKRLVEIPYRLCASQAYMDKAAALSAPPICSTISCSCNTITIPGSSPEKGARSASSRRRPFRPTRFSRCAMPRGAIWGWP
jgi:DNA-binding transcriptional LysR family regulator